MQRPLELGFDLVVHSTTKYLNGHSDMVGGVAVVGDNAELARAARRSCRTRSARSRGRSIRFLALRGLKTLALRMERHCASALKIAQWLERHPKVRRVYYPGPRQPSAARARQAADARLRRHDLGRAQGRRSPTRKRFLERCRLFALAESLGGVESLIEHPALMTHGSVPPEVRATLGIGDTLVRLSVGIEDADDLIADLSAALG